MAYKKNKKLLNYKQLGFSLHDKKNYICKS